MIFLYSSCSEESGIIHFYDQDIRLHLKVIFNLFQVWYVSYVFRCSFILPFLLSFKPFINKLFLPSVYIYDYPVHVLSWFYKRKKEKFILFSLNYSFPLLLVYLLSPSCIQCHFPPDTVRYILYLKRMQCLFCFWLFDYYWLRSLFLDFHTASKPVIETSS